MSETQHKTVFISYRRAVSSFIARAIFLDLRSHGYDVFMDVESIDSGTFDTIILNQIAARAHFLIILTPGTLDRCNEPNDMLRREIERGIDLQRNIVPILVNEFKFDSAKEHLTGQLEQLPRFNGLTLLHDYFDAGMERLRTRFLKQPVLGEIEAGLETDESAVAEIIAEVVSRPAPTQEELNSEEYFQRGCDHPEDEYDARISDFTEAIHLNPQFAEAYNNRGIAKYNKGDFQAAIEDYDRAIQINHQNARAYNNRGNARHGLGDFVGAIEDYNRSIELDSKEVWVYFNRANSREALEDLDGAIEDFDHAILLDANDADFYIGRGEAKRLAKRFHEAIEDFNYAIQMNPEEAISYNNRGLARQSLGELDGAKADFERTVELMSLDDEIRYCFRGNLLRLKGNLQSAIEHYQNYLDLGGGINHGDQKEVEGWIRDLKAQLGE